MSNHRVSNAIYSEAREARAGLRPWFFFLVAGLFYFYEFFARVEPGVLKADILDPRVHDGNK